MEIPQSEDNLGKQGTRPWLNNGKTAGASGSPGKLVSSIIGTLKTSTEGIENPQRGPSPPKAEEKEMTRTPSFRTRQKTIGKQLSKKRLDLRVDVFFGEVKGMVQKDFDGSTVISEAVKQILRRFAEIPPDAQYQLWIPACPQYKTGICTDPRKKLSDYDEEALNNSVLELKPKPTTLRSVQQKVPSLRGKEIVKGGNYPTAPAPKKFLADPNARITVKETGATKDGAGRSLALAFEYTDAESEWAKPDKEGELLKQGSVVKRNWKTRWCVLAGNKLYVFKKQKDEEAAATLMLKGGSISRSQNSKQYAFDLTTMDSTTQKFSTFTFAANNSEEYAAWFDGFENAVKKQTQSTVVSSNVSIMFSPQEGYVGLPPEWKQMLSNCGITERYFYEKPEEVLQMLRYYRSTMAEPLKVHTAPRHAVTSIDDVVTKDVSPNALFEDFVLIGSGTFGEVYRANNKRSQQKVAIKKMLLTPKREPLFISEINVQRNTEHPNVVKLFDAYKVDDHIWVVLEFMEGGNLYQILSSLEESKQLLTEPQIAYIITETLKALSYIHGMHRIHRDIKSDNILIGRNAEVKLADFGYAVQLTDEEEKRTTMAGSPYWMAPEIIEGEEYGKEVDLWSLGIMLMECCDLQPPYINEPPSKALMLITTQDPPPLQKPERWSRELKHFVSVCLQRDPHKRPMSIELLQHPLLRATCQPREFRDSVLSGRKNAKPCLIQ